MKSHRMPNGDGCGNMHSALGSLYGASGSQTSASLQLGPAQSTEEGLPAGDGAGTVAFNTATKSATSVKQTKPSSPTSALLPLPLPVQSGYQLPGPSGRFAGGSGGAFEQVCLQSPLVHELPPQGLTPSASQQALLQGPPTQHELAAQF